MIEANNPRLKSWIAVKEGSDFPIQNLPFGVFRKGDYTPRVASAIGEYVIDLHALRGYGFFDELELHQDVFNQSSLNDFIALGKEVTTKVRERISKLLQVDTPELRDHVDARETVLILQSEVEMLLPIKVGDYTDFYSSEYHARNVGAMFRNPERALLPNWKHMPIGYHGRAGSIVVSGTPIYRPNGQVKSKEEDTPSFGPTEKLDFELEMAFVVGKSSAQGMSIPTEEAEHYIFGFTLFNDWSARDIQAWESVPLGPFLAKSFASAVSPWVVTLEALEPFRVAGEKQSPQVLPYLRCQGMASFDVHLEVLLRPDGGAEEVKIAGSNYHYMYWNARQQLAHQTVNGCNVNVGDLYASGTISGPVPESCGSMLELSWNGARPVQLQHGLERSFVEDGDTIIMRGYAEKEGIRVGFGEVSNKVLKAR